MSMAKKVGFVSALAFGLAAASVPASAATIVGLFDTGVDAAGLVLAAGSTEQHYVITATNVVAPNYASLVPITPTVTSFGAWSANSAVGSTGSAWITQAVKPDNTPAKSGPSKPAGTTPANANQFTYTLNFNLGALNPATASITGDLQADNFAEIYLNGNLVGGHTPVNAPGIANYFRTFTAFGLGSGFVAGNNTLEFKVFDYGSVSGLRVSNLAGTAFVPEPETWAMMIFGFGAVATQLRRRRKTTVLA